MQHVMNLAKLSEITEYQWIYELFQADVESEIVKATFSQFSRENALKRSAKILIVQSLKECQHPQNVAWYFEVWIIQKCSDYNLRIPSLITVL